MLDLRNIILWYGNLSDFILVSSLNSLSNSSILTEVSQFSKVFLMSRIYFTNSVSKTIWNTTVTDFKNFKYAVWLILAFFNSSLNSRLNNWDHPKIINTKLLL